MGFHVVTRYEVVFGLLALLAVGLLTSGVLVLAGLGWALVVAGVLLAVPVVLLFDPAVLVRRREAGKPR